MGDIRILIEQNNGVGVQGGGWSKLLKGCVILVVAICFALIGLLVYIFQRSDIQNIVVCRSNMTEVGQAVIRYHAVIGKYPDNLDDLKKEYLKTPSLLKCPEDKSGSSNSSYVYHKPSAGAANTFVMIECKHHFLEKGKSTILFVTLDGTWSTKNSTIPK